MRPSGNLFGGNSFPPFPHGSTAHVPCCMKRGKASCLSEKNGWKHWKHVETTNQNSKASQILPIPGMSTMSQSFGAAFCLPDLRTPTPVIRVCGCQAGGMIVTVHQDHDHGEAPKENLHPATSLDTSVVGYGWMLVGLKKAQEFSIQQLATPSNNSRSFFSARWPTRFAWPNRMLSAWGLGPGTTGTFRAMRLGSSSKQCQSVRNWHE